MKRFLSLLLLYCFIAFTAWAQNNVTPRRVNTNFNKFYKNSGELTAVEMMLHPFGIFHSNAPTQAIDGMNDKMRRFGWNTERDGSLRIVESYDSSGTITTHMIPFTYKGHAIYWMGANFVDETYLKSYSYIIQGVERNFSKEQAISLAKEVEKELAAYGMIFTDGMLGNDFSSLRNDYYSRRGIWNNQIQVKVSACEEEDYDYFNLFFNSVRIEFRLNLNHLL